MKRTQAGVLSVFACAMTMTLSAQSNPPGGAQQPPTSPPAGPPSASASASKVTVTGCLEKASASASSPSSSPTGTSGAASSGSMEPKFVLNKVTPSASGTAGTAGSSSSAASSYKLDGDDSKLTPHVGHKVEITGSIDDKPSGGARSETSAAAGSSAAPKLKVDAVKMIAGSCTP